MPELPEVETMRRGILGVVGGVIENVQRAKCKCKSILIHPRLDAFRRRAIGRTIRAVDRVGKRVILRLDGGDSIVFEPRMTGLVLVADPPSKEHLRLHIDVKGTNVGRISYWDRRGLGSVQLFVPREFEDRFGPSLLGPDALDVTPGELRKRFCNSRREIKVALLDQRAVAGIGNLYASEILHVAGIHPQRACNRLTLKQWESIHEAIRHVLQDAISHEGSTLSDGTYRNALNQAGGYQNHHRVYDRNGECCPNCDSKIQRIVQAQRSTFFCPTCQTKRGSGKKRTPR